MLAISLNARWLAQPTATRLLRNPVIKYGQARRLCNPQALTVLPARSQTGVLHRAAEGLARLAAAVIPSALSLWQGLCCFVAGAAAVVLAQHLVKILKDRHQQEAQACAAGTAHQPAQRKDELKVSQKVIGHSDSSPPIHVHQPLPLQPEGAVRIVGRGARNGSISFSFDLPPYPLVESHGQQGFEYDKAGHQPSMPHARAIALTLQHIQQDPELSAAIKGRKLCWYVLDHPLAMILNQKTPLDMRGASARRHAFLEEVTFVRRMAQQLSAKVVWYSAPSANFPNSYKLACMLCEATGWKPGVHPSGELAGFSSDIAVAVTKELK